jgi:hypothetical protein
VGLVAVPVAVLLVETELGVRVDGGGVIEHDRQVGVGRGVRRDQLGHASLWSQVGYTRCWCSLAWGGRIVV